MAEEIKIELQVDAHRINNANAVWDHLSLTNNKFVPSGWRLRDTEHAELLLRLPVIPSDIHTTTPNAKARIKWVTASTDVASAIKLFLRMSDVLPDTDTYDPAAWDMDVNATDTSGAAGRANSLDIAISGPSLAAGRELIGVLARNAGDASDVLAADIIITGVLFVADKAP